MRRVKTAAAIAVFGMLSFAAGSWAQSRYPDIDAAEGALQSALGSLRNARNVFGGYKANAEQSISQAIAQLETAKQFAAAHGY